MSESELGDFEESLGRQDGHAFHREVALNQLHLYWGRKQWLKYYIELRRMIKLLRLLCC